MKRLTRFLFRLTPFRIAIAITAAILVLMIPSEFRRQLPAWQLLEFFEYKIFDFRLQLRGPQPASGDVVIVAIDDRTLDELGRWPFSRSRMADAVKNLDAAGAEVIAWDILFSEPDRNSELVKMQELRSTLEREALTGVEASRIDEVRAAVARLENRLSQSARRQLRQSFTAIEQGLDAQRRAISETATKQERFYRDVVASERKANNDRYFARTISDAGNVILGYFFHETTHDVSYLDPNEVDDREELIDDSRISIIKMPAGFSGDLPGRPRYADVEPNIELLSEATAHFGSFTIQQDPDGTIRSYPLLVNFRGESYYPSLALKSVQMYVDAPPVVDLGPTGTFIEGLQLGGKNIPVNEDGSLLINYRGPSRSFPQISFVDVVKNEVPEGILENKIALIGPTAIGIMDLRVTPFDQAMPGVEVHANVMDNVLTSEFYQKPDWMRIFDVFAVIGLGLLLGLFLAPLRAMYIGFVVVAVAALYLVGGQYLLVEQGIWLTTVYPLMEIVSVSIGITIFKYYTEERRRKEIRSAFQYYLSPQVVEEVLENPEMLKLGGAKRNISVLFSDVRGFTSISESLDAEELSQLLNEYLTPMTDLVFDYGGTLDKYMGDAIMAFYGAPLEQPDHAYRACATALDMLHRLDELKPEWAARGYPPVDCGIGINTGPMSVGNMGSEQRFDYTVMGDAVNLGSRLEGQTKSYGIRTIISEYTYAECGDRFFCRELDLVAVKGKKEPVNLYELIAYEGTPQLQELKERFEEALRRYRAGDFQVSFDLWQALLRDFPNDGPTKTFLERSRELINNPPEGEWNGVFVATSK